VCAQAVAHNTACIAAGKALGSKALTVWIGDGANFPGQSHLGRAFERYLESTKSIYAALPEDWRMFIEHKMYEPWQRRLSSAASPPTYRRSSRRLA
jgi:L-rhamnose isomerase/sugar isomerase